MKLRDDVKRPQWLIVFAVIGFLTDFLMAARLGFENGYQGGLLLVLASFALVAAVVLWGATKMDKLSAGFLVLRFLFILLIVVWGVISVWMVIDDPSDPLSYLISLFLLFALWPAWVFFWWATKPERVPTSIELLPLADD